MSTLINVASIIVILALAWTIYNNPRQENKQMIMGLLALLFIFIILDIIM